MCVLLNATDLIGMPSRRLRDENRGLSARRQDLVWINMEHKIEEAFYLIRLVDAAVNGGCVDTPFAGFDWDYLFRLAVDHKVEGMAYIGLSQTSGLPDSVTERFLDAYKKAVVTEYIQHSEGVKLLSAMEKNGIDCMPLKGWIIKPIYPQPAMRAMCDIDILIKKPQSRQVKELLTSMGYSTLTFGGNPDIYTKKPVMNIEIHNALIQDKTDHFATAWNRAVLNSGCRHTYSMTNEDYYIFLSAHLRKHFFGGGTGVRSVTDVWVYLKDYESRLDWAYIEDKLEKSGLWAFDRKIYALCRCWFAGAEKTTEIAELEQQILFSAAYGTQDSSAKNAVLSEINRTVGGKSAFSRKLRYSLRLMFPGVSLMSESYPFVKKYKVLLPFAWIHRGFSSLFSRKNTVKTTLTNVLEIKNDDLNGINKK